MVTKISYSVLKRTCIGSLRHCEVCLFNSLLLLLAYWSLYSMERDNFCQLLPYLPLGTVKILFLSRGY